MFSNLIKRIKDEAIKNPDKIILDVTIGKKLTIQQLDEQSNIVAEYLIQQNVIPGDIVGLKAISFINFCISLLGILKANAQCFIIENLMTENQISLIYAGNKIKVVVSERFSSETTSVETRTLNLDSILNIKSSGSYSVKDGCDKSGIIVNVALLESSITRTVSIQEIMELIDFTSQKLNVKFNQTLLLSDNPKGFQFLAWLGAIINGQNLIHYNLAENQMGIKNIGEMIKSYNIDVVLFPLHLLERIIILKLNDALTKTSVKTLITYGDYVFETKELKESIVSKKIRWINYFDYPEFLAVTVIEDNEKSNDYSLIHKGKPITGYDALIYNQMKMLCPVGKPGELYLRYQGSNSNFQNGNMIQTGYIAEWQQDSKIVFHGRIDGRVHCNGHQIYPYTIERILFQSNMIIDCCVTLQRKARGLSYLTAFVSIKEPFILPQIQEYLHSFIPMAVVPIGFIELSNIPKNKNGMVNLAWLASCNLADSYQAQRLMQTVKHEKLCDEIDFIIREKCSRESSYHVNDLNIKSIYNEETNLLSSDKKALQLKTVEGIQKKSLICGGELEDKEKEPHVLTDTLIRTAELSKDKGIHYIMANGKEYYQSYPQLLIDAEKIYSGLKNSGLQAGDKAILLFNNDIDFVNTFWGCILGGIIPVPVTVPKIFQEKNNETIAFLNIWEILEQPAILSNQDLEKEIYIFKNIFKINKMRVLSTQELKESSPCSQYHESKPDDHALILFTSGSTGIPKGVTQTHRTLLSREKGTTIHNHFSKDDVSLNWMPLEHVGGIVMFHIRDMYLGDRQIQVRTDYILSDPLRWLDLLSYYKVSLTWAPNFSFALVNSRLQTKTDHSWDLKTLRFVLNGGEAINAVSAKKFLKLLQPYGLRQNAMHPAWGMSETCSGVIYSEKFGSEPGQGIRVVDKQSLSGKVKKATSPENSLTFVELGLPIPGISIRIVDQETRIVEECTVGRIQIKGSTVTPGYYKNESLNKEVFSSDGWFETGDLGFVVEGRLTICGRSKDVIIINGINYNNNEIESVVEELSDIEISYTAACSVRDCDNVTDSFVIFYCSKLTDVSALMKQNKAIRNALISKTGLMPDYIIPVQKIDIPKTSIGKIQRSKLSQQYQAGFYKDILKKLDLFYDNDNTLPKWFFQIKWAPELLDLGSYDSSEKNYLIFDDNEGLTSDIIAKLKDTYNTCIVVKSGNKYKKVHNYEYQMDLNSPLQYKILMEDIGISGIHLHKILHARNYENSNINNLYELRKNVQTNFLSLLQLLKVIKVTSFNSLDIYVITSNAFQVTPTDNVVPDNCIVSGFINSVKLEIPRFNFKHIDLTIQDKASHSDHVIREMQSFKNNNQVAWRGNIRYCPVLQKPSLNGKLEKPIIRKGGLYVISGGMGGVGFQISLWLLQNYNVKLLILGTTKIPHQNEWDKMCSTEAEKDNKSIQLIRRIRQVENFSDNFIYCSGDVGEQTFVSESIYKAEKKWNQSVTGVFHLAGNLEKMEERLDNMKRYYASEMNENDYAKAFGAKINGAKNLHNAIKENPEALFVAFSSTMSFFGASSYSAYAAANSFVDGLCSYRISNGYNNTYCLNWSMWDNLGMSQNSSPSIINAMKANGYDPISLRKGLNSLAVLLNTHPGQYFIGLDESNKNIRQYSSNLPIIAQAITCYYTASNKNSDKEGITGNLGEIVASNWNNKNIYTRICLLENLPTNENNYTIDYAQLYALDNRTNIHHKVNTEEPLTEFERTLVTIWKNILGVTEVHVDDNFFELGGNSLKAISLGSNIHKDFDIEIPVAEIFKYPTVRRLAQHLAECSRCNHISISPIPINDHYILSSAQKRMFVLNRLEDSGTTYNIPVFRMMEGNLDIERLNTAFRQLIARHESLRTSFHIANQQPVQIIHSNVDFAIIQSEINEDEIDSLIQKFIRPFHLDRAPLLRVELAKLTSTESAANNRYLFMFDMHHIISDGVSMNILIRDLMAFYDGMSLVPLKIQYKDFAEWQNKFYESESFKKQEEYWLNIFSGEIPVLELPTDHLRPANQQFKGDRIFLKLDQEINRLVNRLSVDTKTTPFMVFLTAFYILLHKYSGQEDIIVGTPSAGRPHVDLDNIIGMFINTIVLRNFPAAGKKVSDFLQEIKEKTLKVFENQDYQFEMLLEKINLKKDQSRNPLFDVFFAFENMDLTEISLDGIDIKEYQYQNSMSKFDMILFAFEKDGTLLLELEYNKSLFQKSTMTNFLSHYVNIVSVIIKNPEIKIADIQMLSVLESKQIISDFNNNQLAYPKEQTIHELLEKQMRSTPNNVALRFGNEVMTYAEVNTKANQLANYLRQHGLHAPETIVAVMMDKSFELIISLIAILKAGGAYLPIDPGYPEDRISYMLKDSKANMLLTTNNATKELALSGLMAMDTEKAVFVTEERNHIQDFESLPMVDRSQIDITKYKNTIGMASVYNCISLQTTRGCPYKCTFCHKVWSKNHVFRSADNIFYEIKFYYNKGIRNFSILDDCFNLNANNGKRLFRLIIDNRLKIQIFFPNGLRGDILTHEYIDLMIEAGVVNINLSLETASPRLQKLVKKHLNLDRFRDNIDYIAQKHNHIILEIATMHGFPTETEEEALMTLDFIKKTNWLHFPYIHILKIYPNTEMEQLALEHGIKKEDIMSSVSLAYHEIPKTLPFPESFTRKYQADFFNNYFLNKERIRSVLPVQLKLLPEPVLLEKYNAYLPAKIGHIEDFLKIAGIDGMELPQTKPYSEPPELMLTGLSKIKEKFPQRINEAKKILYLDLSQHFSSYDMQYKVIEQPLGLLYLATYIQTQFKGLVDNRIYKSGVDFDCYQDLNVLLTDFRPDLICIRTLSFYKDFFHRTVVILKSWFPEIPVIAGGPYATSDYEYILRDSNIDIAVLGEGEHTLEEIMQKMFENDFRIPDKLILKNIKGIAFRENEPEKSTDENIQVLFVEELANQLQNQKTDNLPTLTTAKDLAYVIYTSGSTGKPKGVMIEHCQVNNCIYWMQQEFGITEKDVVIQRTNLTFDPSVWEIFLPLYNGGSVRLITLEQGKDAEYLINAMFNNQESSMLYCPSSLIMGMTYLLRGRDDWKKRLNMPRLLTGAESISMEILKEFYQYLNGKIINTYGPTETAINNTFYHLNEYDDRKILPIGRPVANNQIFILSKDGNLAPIKVPGEICIAGDSVGRGYLFNPQKTKESFVTNPFKNNSVLYRTGDIGRWLEDGNIEILGRLDTQIKLRGYRIELGEIRNALLKMKGIHDNVVVMRDTKMDEEVIRECKCCGITSKYPGIKINVEGMCEICEQEKEFSPIIQGYFKRLEDLKELLVAKNQKGKKSQYDCILLYAGGLGAAYALYRIAEMGFKVLALTYDNENFSDRDWENISIILKTINVDHVRLKHPKTSSILKQSLLEAGTVCKGCYFTSSALAMDYARENGIKIIIGATFSRGQIIENKLIKIIQQGIKEVSQIEIEIERVQKLTREMNAKIFEIIDIPESITAEEVTTIDFYRYDNITNKEMIDYLNQKNSYWRSRKNYAIYSTNCPIKKVGDFIFQREKKYHYYGSATSWEIRIGHITLENLKRDLHCNVSDMAVTNFLRKIALDKSLLKCDVYSKYLCAYIVKEINSSPCTVCSNDENITPISLRKFLLDRVPDYMIPTHYVFLDKLPLTSAGKVDLKNLPPPDTTTKRESDYLAPRNEIEEKIRSVWEEVLGVQGIGINNNFFDLGGDSIKAIQVSSLLQKYSLKLEIKDLFLNPIISQLSSFVKENTRQVSQAVIEGEIALTPIQKWFFEENAEYYQHWNQAIILSNKNGIDEKFIKKVFDKIVQHHDALRMRYEIQAEGQTLKVTQFNQPCNITLYDLMVFDCAHCDNVMGVIEKESNKIQSTFDIKAGPLVKLGLFKSSKGDFLLIAIHHLVIDGISWRIILRDLNSAYSQVQKNQDILLPTKTDSFQNWSYRMRKYSESEKLIKELPYWKSIENKKIDTLRKDWVSVNNPMSENDEVMVTLNQRETEVLLKNVHKVYSTNVNDILLSALSIALYKSVGTTNILIDLEGHGREDIGEGIDISNTVGWFTSIYPFVLKYYDNEQQDLSYLLKHIKEDIRQIPEKGIGYGILKFVTPGDKRETLKFNLKPEICFNYFGQFSTDESNEPFVLADICSGDLIHRDSKKHHVLDIIGMITDNCLTLRFIFSKNQYKNITIQNLANTYKESLLEILNYLQTRKDHEKTPSDIGFGIMSIDEYEQISEKIKPCIIEKYYPLSPMQSGMLFQSIIDNNPRLYFEQMEFTIEGNLDIKIFEKSFNVLIGRYDVLRTRFFYKELTEAKQVVLQNISSVIQEYDLSQFDKIELERFIQNYKKDEQDKGFNLSKDNLLRLTVMKIGETTHKLIWSFHHIISDGWCLGILFKELFSAYNSLLNKKQCYLEPVPAYSTYIQWLQKKDFSGSLSYWQKYLYGFHGNLPFDLYKVSNNYECEEYSFSFTQELSEKIIKFSKANNLTINNIYLTIWGILMKKYSGENDVLFGSVVSGRPPEISGVERMVGLFINTVPVRIVAEPDISFSELANRVQKRSLESKEHEIYPLYELQNNSFEGRQLYDHIIIFENFPIDNILMSTNKSKEFYGFKIRDFYATEQTQYDLNVTIIVNENILSIKIAFNRTRFDKQIILNIENDLIKMANRALNAPDATVNDISTIDNYSKKNEIPVDIEFNF